MTSGGTPERKLFLTLTHLDSGASPTFLMPEELSDGYTNTIDQIGPGHITHPFQQAWTKGQMDDVELTLKLAVDVSPLISDSQALVELVELLYTMTLPGTLEGGTPRPYLDVVQMAISGEDGTVWFRRNYFINKIGVKWEAPYDIATGTPMAATVSLTLAPTYMTTGYMPATIQQLPRRPYSFQRG